MGSYKENIQHSRMLTITFSLSLLALTHVDGCGSRETREARRPEAAPAVTIKLADNLLPQSTGNGRITVRQSELLEDWTRTNEVARNKRFKLGSEEMVQFGEDKGFFTTVLAAYSNHWVLKTRPEDWWTAISQIIATRIDKHAQDPAVREFFVSHEGKKQLTVFIGPTVQGINNEGFFQAMISQITKNINKPEYTNLMASDFSQSTSVDKIVSSIMLMYSFKEYFEYRAYMLCGIPGVTMLGSEEDWSNLIYKLEAVEETLRPIENVLQLGGWFTSSRAVLNNLLETRRGNPDTDWWSRIMNIHTSFGSGGGTTLSGWFVRDFLGLYSGDLKDLPSGLNVVPLTLTDGAREEQSALVAGVTGYNITEGELTIGNITYPAVQSVLGWGLLMNPDSTFN